MKPKEMSMFPIGNTNDMFAKYFIGQSYLNMLSTEQVVSGMGQISSEIKIR